MRKKHRPIHWHGKDELFKEAIKNLEVVDIVLDIGCGIMPQNFIQPAVHICCEPFEEYLIFLQKKIDASSDRQYIFIQSTWEKAIEIFPEKSVDTIFLIDVVEHLKKDTALQLLKKSEKIARKQIAIFTPLGFVKQHHGDGIDAWGLKGGKWQEHKSGWTPEDFDDSWKIFATKEFHFTDNQGKKIKQPFGAFWAIKTLRAIKKTDQVSQLKKRVIHKIYIESVTVNNLKLLQLISKVLSLINRIKKLRKTVFTPKNNI